MMYGILPDLGKLGLEATQALRLPPSERKGHHLKLLQTMFRRSAFLEKLVYSLLQRHVCKHMELQETPIGEDVVVQGEEGSHVYLIMEGEASVMVNGVRVHTMHAGDEFGEMAVLGQTEEEQRRTATVRAATAMVMGKVSRWHYTVAVQEIEKRVMVLLQVQASHHLPLSLRTVVISQGVEMG